MSSGMIKMWFSFGAIICMFIAVMTILFSRHKLRNSLLKIITSLFAYSLVAIAGFIMILVLFA